MRLPNFPDDWGLSDVHLLTETFGSRIFKAQRDNGAVVIVKELKPHDDIEDELRGAHYLRWRDGHGAVRLIAEDGPRLLLEYAGDKTLASLIDSESDQAATTIAADLILQLQAPLPITIPTDLQPLRKRFSSLFKKAKAERNILASSLYCQTAEIAQRLLDTEQNIRPLHGDIHHDNIMMGPRGWLVIDPKGVLGELGFDCANMFYNPLGRDSLCNDPQRIGRMAEIFARTLGQSPRRLLNHAIAYGGLSAAWFCEDGDDQAATRPLAIAASILKVRNLSF